MFLISGSMLMAQQKGNDPLADQILVREGDINNADNEAVWPMFRYQAVLRDANNELVKNQSGKVVFSLGELPWGGEQSFTTNENGLVSVNLYYADLNLGEDHTWKGDTLKAVFTMGTGDDAKTITLKTPVTAVPYALQAADVKLTTDMMVDYIGRSHDSDVERIAHAFEANEPFTEAFVDSVVNYIMANYPIAKDVAFDYLAKVDSQEVADSYDSARLVNDNVKQAVYDVIKNYLKNHRNLLLDVAEYYISTATRAEAEEFYAAFENSSAAPKVREILLDYFAAYLSTKQLICGNSNWNLCSVAAYVAGNTVCPQINNARGYRYGTGTTSDLSTVDRVEYQVTLSGIDDNVLPSTISVSVKIKRLQNEQYVYETLTMSPVSGSTMYYRLVVEDNPGYIITNDGFQVIVNKSGCPQVEGDGTYTNVPNN